MKRRTFNYWTVATLVLSIVTTSCRKDGYRWEFTEETGELVISGSGAIAASPLPDGTAAYPYRDRMDKIKTVTLKEGITAIGDRAFEGCRKLTSVAFGAVTAIGDSAFSDCENLASIPLPPSVKRIGNGAFRGCLSLTSVTLPSSVTAIGDAAFGECANLTSVVLPDSVTATGHATFSHCVKLTSVTLPPSVTVIGDAAFGNCEKLASIVLPDAVTAIGNEAFNNCVNLTSITLPASVTSIGEMAFANCKKLTSVVIPDAVTTIGDQAFRYCTGVTSIVVGDGVKSIGWRAFSDNSGKATMLGDETFGKGKLRSVTLGRNVAYIGNDAFSWAGFLREFTILNPTPPQINHTVFYLTVIVTLYVPAESVNLYKNSEYWNHAHRIVGI
jgi:hypothetical protein